MLGRPRALAAALASLLVAAPALAQPKGPPSAADKQLAGDLVKKAIAKSQEGDHLGAIDLYLQAYSLVEQHTILSNVGNEYQQAQKPVEALRYFCMYLQKDPTGTNATYAMVKAKALQIELGNKSVDDRNVCKSAPTQAPTPDPPTPDDPTPRPSPPAGRSGSPLRWVGIGVGALGAAGLGAGIFFGLKAQKDSDFITNYRDNFPMNSWPDNIHDIEERGQRYEDRQIVALIAGGALVAGGIVLFVVGQSRGKTEMSVQPSAGPDGGGITLTGSF